MADEIKRVNATQLDASLTSMANAIRNKGVSGNFSFPEGMIKAIQNIPTGGGEEPSSIIKTLVGNYMSSSGLIYFNNCPLWVFSSGSANEYIFTLNSDYVILAMDISAVGPQYDSGSFITADFSGTRLIHMSSHEVSSYKDGPKYYNYIPNLNISGYNYITFRSNCSWDGLSQLSFSISGVAHARSDDTSSDVEIYDPSFHAFEGTIWYILKSDLYNL